MVGAPALNNNDRPAGTIPTTGLIPLPADFILDVRDGLYLLNTSNPTTNNARLRRLSYQKMLSRLVTVPTAGVPVRYTVLPPNIRVWRTPDISYNAVLAYYARPAVGVSSTVFNFPDDVTLIEYVRLRGLEWIREAKTEAGAALKYAEGRVADFRKAGLGHEPEDDTIPFDGDQFIVMADQSSAQWLGPFSNQ